MLIVSYKAVMFTILCFLGVGSSLTLSPRCCALVYFEGVVIYLLQIIWHTVSPRQEAMRHIFQRGLRNGYISHGSYLEHVYQMKG